MFIRLSRLTHRIIFSTSVVMIGVLVLLLVSINSAIDQHTKVDKKQLAAKLESLVNTTMATPLFTQDFATVQDLIEQVRLQQTDLLFLQIDDSFNHEIGQFGKQALQDYLLDNPNAYPTAHIAEIRLEGETVGFARYYFRLDALDALKDELDNRVLTVIVIAMVLSIVLTAFITGLLTKGLNRLNQSSKKIAEGDLITPINISSSGDIGTLAHTIEEMRQAVLSRTQEVELEQNRLKSLLNTMTLGILFETSDHQIKYYNSGFLDICNVAEKEILNHPNTSVQDLIERSGLTNPLENLIPPKQSTEKRELHLNDGRIIIQTHFLVDHAGPENGHLWIFEDVTEERLLQSKLEHLANYDSLTGLYNRRYYTSQMQQLAAYAKRHNQYLSMLYFDIDEFKVVNDTYGHPEGDQVLIRIAHELGAIVRKEEVLCRMGGDEFAVLFLVKEKQEAEVLAQRIVDGLAKIRHPMRGDTLRLTTSLGISYYPNPSLSPELLATHSDIAMYEAKKRGKNRVQIYESNPKALEAEKLRLSWKDKIEQALADNQFELHFQGIFNSSDQKLSHLEALIRLKENPNKGGLIYPDQFIPTAEKTGQIILIDRWVITESLSILAQHPEIPSIAINLSGKSFDDPSLPEFIEQSIQHYQINSKRLLIELTETETVQDVHDAESFIIALQKIGCSVCLDDFGTGFASFDYLKHLPVNVLKIDGTFIKDLDQSYENRLFVQSIVMVAKGLGKKTVAEFVENEAAAEACRSLGVDMLQGYHLSKPTPDFGDLLSHD